MKLWLEDTLSRMHSARTENELFETLRVASRTIGFDHCAYGLRIPTNLSNPKTILFNTYPAQWRERYASADYITIDPTVRHGFVSAAPLVWTDDVFREVPEFWEDARSHGLRHGWAQSSIDSHGVRGMLTLSRSNEPLLETELRENGYQMMWLTHITHQRMSELVVRRMLPEATVALSGREKDVLRWTAEGKTSGEIGIIMHLKERTVNFHLANAVAKLSCANKTAAVARACLLGLLN
ncbi:MAG: autoinducer binding domain-containing protein [Gammaproteobacteria bacterium]|nr:autoinducer binding domain-containing protein [Gammaproteobacteria bacterium]